MGTDVFEGLKNTGQSFANGSPPGVWWVVRGDEEEPTVFLPGQW